MSRRRHVELFRLKSRFQAHTALDKTIFVTLRNEFGWVICGTHHATRIHDLRHTFVVRRILLWQQQGTARWRILPVIGHVTPRDAGRTER